MYLFKQHAAISINRPLKIRSNEKRIETLSMLSKCKRSFSRVLWKREDIRDGLRYGTRQKSVLFTLLWVLESLQHTFEICKQKSIIEICFPQKLFGLLELKLGWVHMRNRRFYSYFSFLKWITQIILTNEEPTLFYLEIKVHKYNFNYIRNAINFFCFSFWIKIPFCWLG